MLFSFYLRSSGSHPREAILVFAFTCLTTSVLGYLVMSSRSIQKWALRPEDQDYFDRVPFFIVASVALLLSIVTLLSAFEIGGFELPPDNSGVKFRLRF